MSESDNKVAKVELAVVGCCNTAECRPDDGVSSMLVASSLLKCNHVILKCWSYPLLYMNNHNFNLQITLSNMQVFDFVSFTSHNHW